MLGGRHDIARFLGPMISPSDQVMKENPNELPALDPEQCVRHGNGILHIPFEDIPFRLRWESVRLEKGYTTRGIAT